MTASVFDELALAGLPRDVARARDFTRVLLAEAAYDRIREDVVLAVSELVTNAIVHVGGQVDVRLRAQLSQVRLEVSDRSPAMPEAGVPRDVGGRGLPIVSMVARTWGVEPIAGDGKTVWCEFQVA